MMDDSVTSAIVGSKRKRGPEIGDSAPRSKKAHVPAPVAASTPASSVQRPRKKATPNARMTRASSVRTTRSGQSFKKFT